MILLTPFLLGWDHARVPDELKGESRPTASSSNMTVVFIDEEPTRSQAIHILAVVLRPVPAHELRVSVPKVPEGDGEHSESDTEAQDIPDETRTLLRGRYVNQISARIERAWVRPRSALAESEVFDCQVWVTQDPRGQVLDIMPDRCNPDARWRASLLLAIRSASPLPAPPDPSVFTQRVRLSFRAGTYTPGGPIEGFEGESPHSLSAASRPSPTVVSDRTIAPDEFEAALSQLRARGPGAGTIDLRISGTSAPPAAVSGNPQLDSPPAPPPSDPGPQM